MGIFAIGEYPACSLTFIGHPRGVLCFFFGCVGFGFELGSVRYAQRDAGAHTPSEDRQACLSGAGRGYLHALREYPATPARSVLFVLVA